MKRYKVEITEETPNGHGWWIFHPKAHQEVIFAVILTEEQIDVIAVMQNTLSSKEEK